MRNAHNSRLHVQSDAAGQTKFTTLRVRDNGETGHRKAYPPLQAATVAHRRANEARFTASAIKLTHSRLHEYRRSRGLLGPAHLQSLLLADGFAIVHCGASLLFGEEAMSSLRSAKRAGRARVPFLATMFCAAWATTTTQAQSPTGEAYVIVHAHNPEGVEINSIEGMQYEGIYYVEVFDGDVRLGCAPCGLTGPYECWPQLDHNVPVALSPGTHTIRAEFNGMKREETITLAPGQTGTVTFVFERTEFDIARFLSSVGTGTSFASGTAECRSDSGGASVTGDREGTSSDARPDTGLVFMCAGYCRLPAGSAKREIEWQASVDYAVDPSELRIIAVRADTSCGDCELDVDFSFAGWREDVSAIFTGDHPFDDWYVQNLVESVPTPPQLPWPRVQLTPSPDALRVGASNGVVLYDWEWLSRHCYLFRTPAWWSYAHLAIFDGLYNPDGTPISGAATIKLYLSNLRISSVPYDLKGTGLKDTTNQPPVAAFTYSPEDPHAGETASFDASSSQDPDGEVVGYQWDFGDGNTGGGALAVHSYAKPGDYTVALTVTDNAGLTDTEQNTVHVKCCEGGDWYLLEIPPLTLGKLSTVSADSGERLEVWGVLDPNAWHYELRYFRPGAGPELTNGVRIGQCTFVHGCNEAAYYGPNTGGDPGKVDCFVSTDWWSWDYGEDDYPSDGCLDVYRFYYDVCSNKVLPIQYDLCYRCGPPLEPRDPNGDFCDLRPECTPPYVPDCICTPSGTTHKNNHVSQGQNAALTVGPDTEALFDQLSRDVGETARRLGLPPDGIPMGSCTRPRADLDWDGDVDAADTQIAIAAAGKCQGDVGYDPWIDMNADGCVDGVDADRIRAAVDHLLASNSPTEAGPQSTTGASPAPCAAVPAAAAFLSLLTLIVRRRARSSTRGRRVL
jgi:hypothetical protein